MDKVCGFVQLLDVTNDEGNPCHGLGFFAPVGPEGYADVELLMHDRQAARAALRAALLPAQRSNAAPPSYAPSCVLASARSSSCQHAGSSARPRPAGSHSIILPDSPPSPPHPPRRRQAQHYSTISKTGVYTIKVDVGHEEKRPNQAESQLSPLSPLSEKDPGKELGEALPLTLTKERLIEVGGLVCGACALLCACCWG